jgi:hypothetical protein
MWAARGAANDAVGDKSAVSNAALSIKRDMTASIRFEISIVRQALIWVDSIPEPRAKARMRESQRRYESRARPVVYLSNKPPIGSAPNRSCRSCALRQVRIGRAKEADQFFAARKSATDEFKRF